MPTTINDELTRIESSKADIATAIGNKGVTVPANAKIDDYATLIDTIQTGGGSSIYYDFIKGLFENTLTDVVVPDGVTSLRAHALRGLTNATSLTIPDSVTSIGINCCDALSNLVTFNGGSGLLNIGANAFVNCVLLENVNLKSVYDIGVYAFNACYKLTNFIIPNNIYRIQAYALRYTNLTTLIVKKNTPPLIDRSAFPNTPMSEGTGYIYVPNTVVDDYKSATNWSAFANQIKGYDIDSQGRIVDADDHTHILVNADGTFYVEP